jgi:deoxyadenosine/deoxycytidine kinase/ribonuclease HI
MSQSTPQLISIEGNIGSGKSTLIEKLRTAYKDYSNICFLQEPVDIWNTITDKEGNTMLSKFYTDAKKYSFAFQMMAYISRLSLLKNALKENYDIIVVERSMFTDKMVFAKMLYEDGNIEDVEYQIYNKWFHHFIEELPPIHVIYVKTTPEVAFERVVKRSRTGEIIPLEYLINCHKYHENWLNIYDNSMITIDGNTNIDQQPEMMEVWLKRCAIFMDTQCIMETHTTHHTLMFDGGSRGNPGICGSGFVIYDGDTLVWQGYKKVSENNTNNYAEYMGIILGLEMACEKEITYLHIKGDSLLVINQLLGKWKLKSDHLKPLYKRAKTLLANIKMVTISHVKREQNQIADKLANKAMDE